MVALLALASLMLGGCGLVHSKEDAEKVLARHYHSIATNGFSVAMDDYGAQFFQKTSKAEWTKALEKISKKLGTYQSHMVTSWNATENAGTLGAGVTVKLQCDVTYSKHAATETFTLFKGIGDSDYKILGHYINSTALLTE